MARRVHRSHSSWNTAHEEFHSQPVAIQNNILYNKPRFDRHPTLIVLSSSLHCSLLFSAERILISTRCVFSAMQQSSDSMSHTLRQRNRNADVRRRDGQTAAHRLTSSAHRVGSVAFVLYTEMRGGDEKPTGITVANQFQELQWQRPRSTIV